MLLPRALLRAQNIPLESATFSRAEGGKPYVVGDQILSYNIFVNLTNN